MKRASALIAVILCCLMMSVTSFAEEIYIIEDGEDEFIPAETTTVEQVETTTSASDGGLNIDTDSIGDYLGSIADKLGGGMDSILSGFEDFDFDFGNNTETTTSSGLSGIQAGNYPTANKSDSMTTYPNSENNQQSVQTEETTAAVEEEELPSVLVVGGSTDDDSRALSGSTLTLFVFIAAIIILVLVVIIVLIILSRRTEFNSSVKQKSTLPSVERPSALAQFIEDDIPSDGKDYSDIAYWNK
ncbi:MAG: hypothetical protein IJZ35_09105 [Clostridia bacterium]|nr:hypothetical protein [Clostridia bacterium]